MGVWEYGSSAPLPTTPPVLDWARRVRSATTYRFVFPSGARILTVDSRQSKVKSRSLVRGDRRVPFRIGRAYTAGGMSRRRAFHSQPPDGHRSKPERQQDPRRRAGLLHSHLIRAGSLSVYGWVGWWGWGWGSTVTSTGLTPGAQDNNRHQYQHGHKTTLRQQQRTPGRHVQTTGRTSTSS